MAQKPFTREDSIAFGLKRRRQMRRVELATFKPAEGRDPLAPILASCAGRIRELLPVKFKRMAVSPFAFYRGSAPLMASDLASGKHTDILCQIGGDAHICNFGFFATPDSKVVFDANDFDETIRGPWEWDVKRLAVSAVLAGRESGARDSAIADVLRIFLDAYNNWVRLFSTMAAISVARHRVNRDLRDAVLHGALSKAERATPERNLQKFCVRRGGKWQFRNLSGVMWNVGGKTRRAVLDSLTAYRATLSPDHQMLFDHYRPVDVGFKVVGVGSVGTRDHVVLLFGADEHDPLLLQVKEATHPAYAPYLTQAGLQDTGPGHQGERVVRGQRAMQLLSDVLLGWTTIDGRDYLVRQLNDHKSSVDPGALKPVHLREYMRVCAEVLAKGNCRSGDPIAMAAYLGNSEKATVNLAKFAFTYADQVEADFSTFRKALRSGRLNLRRQ